MTKHVFELGQLVQPMDQPEKASRIVDILCFDDHFKYILDNDPTWYHEDELECP